MKKNKKFNLVFLLAIFLLGTIVFISFSKDINTKGIRRKRVGDNSGAPIEADEGCGPVNCGGSGDSDPQPETPTQPSNPGTGNSGGNNDTTPAPDPEPTYCTCTGTRVYYTYSCDGRSNDPNKPWVDGGSCNSKSRSYNGEDCSQCFFRVVYR